MPELRTHSIQSRLRWRRSHGPPASAQMLSGVKPERTPGSSRFSLQICPLYPVPILRGSASVTPGLTVEA